MPLIRHCLAANTSRKNVFIQQITCCLIRVGLAATPDGSAHRYLIAAIVLGHVQPLVGVKNQLATV